MDRVTVCSAGAEGVVVFSIGDADLGGGIDASGGSAADEMDCRTTWDGAGADRGVRTGASTMTGWPVDGAVGGSSKAGSTAGGTRAVVFSRVSEGTVGSVRAGGTAAMLAVGARTGGCDLTTSGSAEATVGTIGMEFSISFEGHAAKGRACILSCRAMFSTEGWLGTTCRRISGSINESMVGSGSGWTWSFLACRAFSCAANNSSASVSSKIVARNGPALSLVPFWFNKWRLRLRWYWRCSSGVMMGRIGGARVNAVAYEAHSDTTDSRSASPNLSSSSPPPPPGPTIAGAGVGTTAATVVAAGGVLSKTKAATYFWTNIRFGGLCHSALRNCARASSVGSAVAAAAVTSSISMTCSRTLNGSISTACASCWTISLCNDMASSSCTDAVPAPSIKPTRYGNDLQRNLLSMRTVKHTRWCGAKFSIDKVEYDVVLCGETENTSDSVDGTSARDRPDFSRFPTDDLRDADESTGGAVLGAGTCVGLGGASFRWECGACCCVAGMSWNTSSMEKVDSCVVKSGSDTAGCRGIVARSATAVVDGVDVSIV
ncbi:hypothetical protein H310_07690 [Aphanomyces invadans]|uniref:Uncharacterized protein n=1 Tax=Aphanomyces invadans TaxID=157072 RepID=A0A024U242_9STRA|nr:hypothetical protein H310_07690 [Aphanomyces invadans]ETW00319.1 hypothetical protein H310_07690 [Aphanomyces invadans]|eukprot:XP_008871344.1 hypothetical protein H310_07690 [Aphanomyces invadans]